MSGDESDYILDYKRRNSTFPHETTLDQFFNEEQFEVYRALGFHVARNLLTGSDVFHRRWPLESRSTAELKSAGVTSRSRPSDCSTRSD
jgi:hypothetical protein